MPVGGDGPSDDHRSGGDGGRGASGPSPGVTGALLRPLAARAAARERLPTPHRAILGHYAETGTLDYRALRIKSAVDDAVDRMLDDVHRELADALAVEFEVESVEFAYETKLTLPAELTLGYLYRRALARSTAGYDPIGDDPSVLPWRQADPDLPPNREAREYVERAEETTAMIVRALIDGDMRDALNDDEFEDFVVEMPAVPDPDPRRVAACVQGYLQTTVEAAFDRAPDAVRAAYDEAVEISEAHQERDERFRDLYRAAVDGDGTAVERIESEYKFASFPGDPPFAGRARDLPYLKTQYDRVGVIYRGMLDAYRGVGFEIPTAFGTSIVLAIIGAQIWLDDVDDYPDDRAEGQLTPVTAEYVLADDECEAHGNVVSITEQYLDLAREHATEAGSTLTGIAVEYILRSGDPDGLPGA